MRSYFSAVRELLNITGASLEASGGRSIVLNPEFSYEKKAATEAAEK